MYLISGNNKRLRIRKSFIDVIILVALNRPTWNTIKLELIEMHKIVKKAGELETSVLLSD